MRQCVRTTPKIARPRKKSTETIRWQFKGVSVVFIYLLYKLKSTLKSVLRIFIKKRDGKTVPLRGI